jgi:malate synthase
MLNSGAPGVMIDLEDSMANKWPNLMAGHRNAVAALHGQLQYFDQKRQQQVGIRESATVIYVRVRGLHLSQAGIFNDGPVAAPLFDLAMLMAAVDPARLKHPLSIYIPKSESAEEALWWRDAFARLAEIKGIAKTDIRAMALVESHPLAFQMEEFIYNLRDHLMGLNLGRWDYMASLIHFNLHDPRWVLPDRNTIPHDVPFFQNLRVLMPEICHKRGILAIGGMTALYPSRQDPELNARALAVLEKDKKNEANALMDGAWTGHPDQNEIAVAQFPYPNQLDKRPTVAAASAGKPGSFDVHPDLRPLPEGVGKRSIAGSRAAARVTTLYRRGVLSARGASLIDGYMEDLATDRIYRLMLTQRMLHSAQVPLEDGGREVGQDGHVLTQLYDEELAKLPALNPPDEHSLLERAREASEDLILEGWHTPV